MDTTTEEVLTLSPAIITLHCVNGGWLASLANNSCKWEWGTTEAEAIGKLHLLHQDVLGTIRREEQ